jgi:hypothetical protein
MDEEFNHAVLNKCDLSMARDEIANMHKLLNAKADREGIGYYFSPEYVAAWEAFRDHPSMDNAAKFLEVVPGALQYFETCCPGTMIYEANKSLKERGLK